MPKSRPLTEFIATVPSPLTATLVHLSRPIALVRRVAEITSWKSHWAEGWLALAAWWAICLLADTSLRYALPLLSLAVLVRYRSKPTSSPPPITESSLHKTIADLDKIQDLTPVPAPLPTPPIAVLLRVSAILYLPYLFLTYFVRLRVLVALAGTIVLSWRAPWAATIRHALWRSAWIRWGIYRLWSLLSGEPLPPQIKPASSHPVTITSASAKTKTNGAVAPPTASLRFLFTVHENQRWWMGLDWTAALLPQERPAWSSPSSEDPVSPPSVFTLPASTIVYHERDNGRVKRTATWKWEEDEWRVLVKKEGSGTSRVERPLPSLKDEVPTSKRLLKAAGMMRDPSGREEDQSTPMGGSEDEDEPWTDGDGWVYADNKWEGASGKGGMGKYTRYRRWTRIAVLTESIEVVGPGDVGVYKEEPAVEETPEPTHDRRASVDSEGERAGIRHRLKTAVSRSSTTSV